MAIKFSDAKKSVGRSSWLRDGYERVSAKEFIGKEFEIVDVEEVPTNFGDEARAVYLANGKVFVTSSRVLIDQIENVIKPMLEKGETVIASLGWAKGKSGRRYLTFL